MTYARSPLMRIQLFAQAIFLLAYALLSWSAEAEAFLAGILLCTVGIPHGANDYLYRKEMGGGGLFTFTLAYLGVMGVYALLWWWLPVSALLLFFAISFHHFGQSNFESPRWTYLPALLWGTWILVFPVLLHWEEALVIFMQMTSPGDADMLGLEPSAFTPVFRYVIAALLALAYLASLLVYRRSDRVLYIVQWLLVSVWYLLTPLLFGFVVVFCLWHSLQSLQHQIRHQAAYYHRSAPGFVRAMLPFGIAALLAFGAFVWWRGFHISEAFILLSLITLPHVLVMHRLYHKAAV